MFIIVPAIIFSVSAILIVALIMAVSCLNVGKGALYVATVIAIVVFVISTALICLFATFSEVKTVNVSNPSQRTYQLAKISAGNHDYYLYEEEDSFHYLYLEANQIKEQDAPLGQVTIHYTDEQPNVVVTQTTCVTRKEWWIFFNSDTQETSTQYEFHVKNRDSIKYSFENS